MDFFQMLVKSGNSLPYESFKRKFLKRKIRDLSQVVIYGAGARGKVLFDEISSMGGNILYFLDRMPKQPEYLGCPVYSLERNFSETNGGGGGNSSCFLFAST